jgi:tetratricopeptide (TPR) repeat protein
MSNAAEELIGQETPSLISSAGPGYLNSRSVHIFIIAFVSILVYSNTFNVPFQYDDNPNIVRNPIISDLGYFSAPSGARGFSGFAEYPALTKRYIGHLSFALNYRLHGLDVLGYHIVNLVIHITNGALVYLLVVLTFQTPGMRGSALGGRANLIGLFSALLFVCHPVQTQAVTYIVQRLTSMAAMFYLAAIVLYIGFRITEQKSARRAMYALSIISAVLAMKTKEVAFTLPLAVAMYEFMFLGGKWRNRLLYLIPILLTLLIIPVTLITLPVSGGPSDNLINRLNGITRAPAQDMSRLEYLATETRVVITYIRLLFLPVNQNLYYDYPAVHSLLESRALIPLAFLSSVFGLGVYMLLRSRGSGSGRFAASSAGRLAAFGVFWFFLALSVESSLIPLEVINEHRIYLPSAGAFVALVTGAFMVLAYIGEPGKPGARIACVALAAAVILALSVTAHTRNAVWESRISLWKDVTMKSPRNPIAHNNLGNAYSSEGMTDRAIEHYMKAIMLKPDFAEAFNNLGNSLRAKGMTQKAIENLRIALRLSPDYPEAHSNIAAAYNSIQMTDRAIEHYRTAISLKPDYVKAHYYLGVAYLKTGDEREAMREFETVLAINPKHHMAKRLLDNIRSR